MEKLLKSRRMKNHECRLTPPFSGVAKRTKVSINSKGNFSFENGTRHRFEPSSLLPLFFLGRIESKETCWALSYFFLPVRFDFWEREKGILYGNFLPIRWSRCYGRLKLKWNYEDLLIFWRERNSVFFSNPLTWIYEKRIRNILIINYYQLRIKLVIGKIIILEWIIIINISLEEKDLWYSFGKKEKFEVNILECHSTIQEDV